MNLLVKQTLHKIVKMQSLKTRLNMTVFCLTPLGDFCI